MLHSRVFLSNFQKGPIYLGYVPHHSDNVFFRQQYLSSSNVLGSQHVAKNGVVYWLKRFRDRSEKIANKFSTKNPWPRAVLNASLLKAFF